MEDERRVPRRKPLTEKVPRLPEWAMRELTPEEIAAIEQRALLRLWEVPKYIN